MGFGGRSSIRPGMVPFSWVAVSLGLALAAVVYLQWPRGQEAGSKGSDEGSASGAVRTDHAPPCVAGDSPTRFTSYDDWRRTLVDRRFRLPANYAPPDLVSTSLAGFRERFLVRRLLIRPLAALRRAARRGGNAIGLAAAYRSYRVQASLFRRRRRELGREVALSGTARPGHSEHQLGTTVDFKTGGSNDVHRRWGGTSAGRWVAANAYRFGFIQSYPRDSDDVTCYRYEPWHYRYFGAETARRIHDSGLTVREFLWRKQYVP